MQQLDGTYDGNLLLCEDAELHGTVVGNLTVTSGISLTVIGMITGDLSAQAGSTVIVRGIVRGAVVNESADVAIFGIVGAGVRDLGSTKSAISEAAIITPSN